MTRAIRTCAAIVAFAAAATVAATTAFAGNPPSGAERIIGPPIEGVFVGQEAWVEDQYGNAYPALSGFFVGTCKNNQEGKQEVSFSIVEPVGDFAALTEADLLHYREQLAGVGPAGCFSDYGHENLIVTGVQKFVNVPSMGMLPALIGAEIQLSVVESKTTGN